jgi:hypothetical protein
VAAVGAERPLGWPSTGAARGALGGQERAAGVCLVWSSPDDGPGATTSCEVFDLNLEHGPDCGGEGKVIAVVLERPMTERILTHIGLDPQPPPEGCTRERMNLAA